MLFLIILILTYNVRCMGMNINANKNDQYYDLQNQWCGRGGLPNDGVRIYVNQVMAMPVQLIHYHSISIRNLIRISQWPICQSNSNLGIVYMTRKTNGMCYHPMIVSNDGTFTPYQYGRTTQSKYRKKPTPKRADIEPSEIRIRGTGGNIKQYVLYASNLLSSNSKYNHYPSQKAQKDEDEQKRYDLIEILATGRAIGKAMNCVEVIKWKIYGLHQLTRLETGIREGLHQVKKLTIASNIHAIFISELLLSITTVSMQPNNDIVTHIHSIRRQ